LLLGKHILEDIMHSSLFVLIEFLAWFIIVDVVAACARANSMIFKTQFLVSIAQKLCGSCEEQLSWICQTLSKFS
jgi:hypothetical protein